ncbi:MULTISPECIES: AAA family ATPase [unclassified Sphingomonas]|uniref:AAA family ATPase n=1 Tax=unclassified Sphingomonas TaxID=196159 RepID=UPI0006F21585|nr:MULTISPECIES: AAA family ATPase [unclassified Sphingomonas]KQM67031.1 DNA polymerase [Sphingomonas sp. Leaf16]KQN17978.1 DNA polymerase [Sphingomonas sp. Leaf29]KQN23841.1 DNA polymerase [Sphingomonas sp. Leaf32]
MPLIGNDAAREAFVAAAESVALHHAWLLTGPEGIGKGGFAREMAQRLLATALDGRSRMRGEIGEDHRVMQLMASGAHPDYRELVRLPKDPDKPDQDIARSIKIDQVRTLQPMFATKPALSTRRVVVIDAIDDLERPGANALLKNLEEPPVGTIFLLVSHSPGRLLPTIRSRCRQLRFDPLRDEEVARVLRDALPELDGSDVDALVTAAEGAPGRALAYAGLSVAALDRDLSAIAETGDADNRIRSRLAKALAGKTAQPRYAVFLDRAPALIAAAARTRSGPPLRDALDAYEKARALAAMAPALSLVAETTVFEMAGLVARLAPARGIA